MDRLRFERDGEGKVSGLVRQGFGGDPKRSRRTTEAPVERKEVRLNGEQLERCVGRYELAPGFVLEITREGDRLFSQVTGQPKLEIFAQSETELFFKEVDAQLSVQLDATSRRRRAPPGAVATCRRGGSNRRSRSVRSR
jgi:hypothetical protein